MITGTAGVSPLRLLRSGHDRAARGLADLGWRPVGRDVVSPGTVFVLRVSTPAGVVTGVAAVFAVTDPPQRSGLLPHERTDERAVRRRLRALRSAHVDRDPLLLTHRGGGAVGRLVTGRTRPAVVHHDPSGARVEVEQVDDDAVPAVLDALSGARLLVADGHHRLAASVALAAEGRSSSVTGLVVDADETPFSLDAIHRVLLDGDGRERLPPDASADVLARCRAAGARVVAVTDDGGAAGDDAGAGQRVVVQHEQRRWAVSWPGHPVADVTTLVDAVLVEEEGTRIRREPSVVAASGAASRGAVAVLLPAPRLDDVLAMAGRGVLLPYKATAFEPKVPSGVLVRPLPAWDAAHAAG
ncbi:DUF1015 family protein [Aquipuribacter sp. SD81]|uniref:DUF1015 family protein n=1 Tax=Aquipuribacter sp. SD81 TaxID=3127703 RepID=UPI003019353F